MDEQFPPNSRKARAGGPPVEKPKMEKVVVGEVVLRKPPLGRRLFHTFFGGDAHSVVGYVVRDIVVPAIRDILVDAVSSGFERLVHGERSGPTPRTGYRSGSRPGFVSYNSISSGPSTAYRREEGTQRQIIRRADRFDTREIVFQTRAEAQEVLNRLFDAINEYQQVTWSDLMDCLGLTSPYTGDNYGWTDIRGTGIVRTGGGWLLDLPPVQPLK